jgi:hypothetical protein
VFIKSEVSSGRSSIHLWQHVNTSFASMRGVTAWTVWFLHLPVELRASALVTSTECTSSCRMGCGRRWGTSSKAWLRSE